MNNFNVTTEINQGHFDTIPIFQLFKF
jgi:hypothetical protein